MTCRNLFFCLSASLLVFLPSVSSAELSKGHRVLVERGLQVQGLCIDDNFVTVNTYTNANYTSFAWLNQYTNEATSGDIVVINSSRPEWMGAAPGVLPWSRWARHETLMPPQVTPHGGDEAPYMSQLIAVQMGDEWDLNNDTVRTRLVDWFIAERTNWPNTILYHNSWGTQIGDAALADFYNRAKPDMLSFDTYPWKSVYAGTDTAGDAIGGPPTPWYGDLRRYREHARGAGIPYAIYRQTFHAIQNYDSTVYRDPSASELRLNTFAALAFNAKFFTDYTYNTGANSFFTKPCNWCGDSVIGTNGLYAEQSDVNLRAQNFGKALVRLAPITTEGIPGYTTSMMFVRGRDSAGNINASPVGFLTDQDTGNTTHTDWDYQRNDPYLTNTWVVTNTGTKNNGQPGDVIVSWFKLLDESFDGPEYTNELYMMVVNGLTDTNGTATDCRQEIKLNFHSSVAAIEILNPLTGIAELQLLPLTNGVRQLTLNLNGGDGALFKFATGAPFVGVESAITGPPIITLQPMSRENVWGTEATFIGGASGSAPVGYQWQLNDGNIAGATMNTYTRNAVEFSDAGTYTLVASNALGTATSASATLTVVHPPAPFFYEPFNYSNIGGPVSSNTPANWTHNTGTATNDTHVTSGNLSYSGLPESIGNSVTNGGVGLGARRLFGTNISSGTLYFSALFRMNNPGFGTWNGASSQVGALTATDNTSFRLSVLVKSNSPSGYIFGVQKGGGIATFSTNEYQAGDTVFLVGKYDFTVNPNSVTLWINPPALSLGIAPPTSGFISTNSGTDGFIIDRFNIRQNTAVSVPMAMQWDELRLDRSWNKVTPLFSPPEPATLDNLTQLSDGRFQFSYSSSSARGGSVYASTNLIEWTFVGTPTQVSPGAYQFTDPTATNHPNRFYQLRWP